MPVHIVDWHRLTLAGSAGVPAGQRAQYAAPLEVSEKRSIAADPRTKTIVN